MKRKFNHRQTFKERKRDLLTGFLIPVLAVASWVSGAQAGKVYGPKLFNGEPAIKRDYNSNQLVEDINEPIDEPIANKLEETVNDFNEPNELNKPYEPNNVDSAPLEISQKGIELIKQYEDFSPTPYPDSEGISIGYGHQIRKGENLVKMTEPEAYNLLITDLKTRYETAVRENVTVPLNQNQYDALCSFIYNIGPTAFKESTFLKKFNNKDGLGAANELDRWVHDYIEGEDGETIKVKIPGLVERRAEEKQLFLSEVKN